MCLMSHKLSIKLTNMETGIGSKVRSSKGLALNLRITVERVYFIFVSANYCRVPTAFLVLKFDYKSPSVNCKRYWKLPELNLFLNLPREFANKQKCCKTYMRWEQSGCWWWEVSHYVLCCSNDTRDVTDDDITAADTNHFRVSSISAEKKHRDNKACTGVIMSQISATWGYRRQPMDGALLV